MTQSKVSSKAQIIEDNLHHHLESSSSLSHSAAHQKIELYVSCRNLKDLDIISLSDPFVRLYGWNNNKEVLIGETEVAKDNLNPNFVKSFKLDFYFEERQPLRLEVIDKDTKTRKEVIGQVLTTLGEVMGKRNHISINNITHKNKLRGIMILRAEPIEGPKDEIKLEIKGENLKVKSGILSKVQTFIQLKRVHGDGSDIVVYESRPAESTKKALWKEVNIRAQALCNNDFSRKISLSVYYKDGYANKLVGECSFTISQLKKNHREFELTNPKDHKPAGTIIISQFNLISRSSFLEYIKGGVELNTMVAVDFTSSNKDPKDPNSLHAIHNNGVLNDYQSAIRDVCEILLCYDYDQQVSVYGFGGKPAWRYGVDHCFSLTADDNDPNVSGLDGIMKIYQDCLKKIVLGQPTIFKEILDQAVKVSAIAKNSGSKEYTVLLILTDGMIHDMTETIDVLVSAARLPLSVIIVGVGKSQEFERMKALDGDGSDAHLCNTDGEIRERDLVQFVAYNDFKQSHKKLAREVLGELPRQFLEYMDLENIKPAENVNVDIEKLVSLYSSEVNNHSQGHGQQHFDYAPNLGDLTVSQKFVVKQQLGYADSHGVFHNLNEYLSGGFPLYPNIPSFESGALDDDEHAVPFEPISDHQGLVSHIFKPFEGNFKSKRELDTYSSLVFNNNNLKTSENQ